MSIHQTEINISPNNIFGECDLKCIYNYTYQNSSCVATNNGVMLLLSYDKTSTPPVTYNNNKYDVGQVAIYSPSLHKYNDDVMDAEIIITHNPVLGGSQFAVAIPIIQSTSSTKATILLSQIITRVATSAPKNGESTTISLTDYSLNSFIPKHKFYSYIDTQNNIEYIVFDKEQSIDLSKSMLNTLKSVINKYNNISYGGNVFYSKYPPNTQSGDGEIYISCLPTGNSEENIDVMHDKPAIFIDNNITSNPIFKGIFGFLIFILWFYIIKLLIFYFGKSKKS